MIFSIILIKFSLTKLINLTNACRCYKSNNVNQFSTFNIKHEGVLRKAPQNSTLFATIIKSILLNDSQAAFIKTFLEKYETTTVTFKESINEILKHIMRLRLTLDSNQISSIFESKLKDTLYQPAENGKKNVIAYDFNKTAIIFNNIDKTLRLEIVVKAYTDKMSETVHTILFLDQCYIVYGFMEQLCKDLNQDAMTDFTFPFLDSAYPIRELQYQKRSEIEQRRRKFAYALRDKLFYNKDATYIHKHYLDIRNWKETDILDLNIKTLGRTLGPVEFEMLLIRLNSMPTYIEVYHYTENKKKSTFNSDTIQQNSSQINANNSSRNVIKRQYSTMATKKKNIVDKHLDKHINDYYYRIQELFIKKQINANYHVIYSFCDNLVAKNETQFIKNIYDALKTYILPKFEKYNILWSLEIKNIDTYLVTRSLRYADIKINILIENYAENESINQEDNQKDWKKWLYNKFSPTVNMYYEKLYSN